jgi:Na+/proline symporter
MKYDRRTLIINFCGLALALVLAAENVYFDYKVIGLSLPGSYWPVFVPLVVMFIVGRRNLSYVFLVMYALLIVFLMYQAWLIYDSKVPQSFLKGIGIIQGILVVLSVVCLSFYAVLGVIRWLSRRLKSVPKPNG